MGYLTFFPYVQPEQEHFVLNLGERDQRIAAYLLMVLAKSEDMYNLRDPHYILPNGVEDPLTTGIPASWQFLDKLPRGGQLSISYNCAPEKRNLNKRITLFEKYGHRKMTAKMEDILWWSSLQDTPNDVIVFMEFIAEKYDDVSHAFSVMCHNHSEMTLRDFEDAYRRIGCTRFKDKSHGQDEKLRLQAVFRFLDPGGEGTVSKQEFMILGQMFSEYRLAIEEFVQFCIRTFGTDLMDSWYFLDDNDDGEIDRDEWQKACEFLGYLGLVMPIFRFLDTDNQGTISLDEFMQLEKFFNQTGIE
jgi:Ca2+-binding EF-hand superfamily protein